MELLTSTVAQAEFKLMAWEMFARLFFLGSLLAATAALAAYSALVHREVPTGAAKEIGV